MRLGMIVRSDDRGLGNMTMEFFRHLHPERVLIVHPQHRIRTPWHDERFDGAEKLVTTWRNQFNHLLEAPEAEIREWLDGLDLVYSAETYYDWRIVDWARMQGVRTVCHVMPEYFRHARPGGPSPADVWWNPTPWLQETVMPPGTRIVPVPVPLDRWPTVSTEVHDPIRWLHVGGLVAAKDRNGLQTMRKVVTMLRERHHLTIRAQGERIDPIAMPHPNVDLTLNSTAVDNYWELYDGFDALMLPRRYGGLCLPALEAMGAGLAISMPDLEPQCSIWPIIPYPCSPGPYLLTMVGHLHIFNIDPADVAATMDRIASDPSELIAARKQSREWAEANSWDQLLPVIETELEQAATPKRRRRH